MAREGNRRSRQASRPSSGGHSPLPAWIWGLAGLGVGLFVALLVQLHHSRPSSSEAVTGLFQQPHERATRHPDEPSYEDRAGQRHEPDQPQFEFYKLLPDQKVSVPAPEPSLAAPSAKPPSGARNAEHPQLPSTKTKPGDGKETSAGYLLQVGSFRNFNDADQLKAHLALLGIEASIQDVELASGETWHRVRVGPFSDRANLNTVRKRLQTNKIHTILLKRGG